MAENNICHIEFFADDLDRAQEFYGGLFGWSFAHFGDTYRLFETQGGPDGAFYGDDNPGQRVRCYIEVTDIEARLRKIEAAGGKTVVPKTQISEDYGYFAMFMDPLGNLMGLWSRM